MDAAAAGPGPSDLPSGLPSGRRPPDASPTAAAAAAKPLLRGWLHLATFPVAVLAGVTLAVLATTTSAAAGLAVFTVCAGLLFGVSALYHRGTWPARSTAVLRRFDHANIFLLIAGTYTPFALLLLRPPRQQVLLGLVWGSAAVGVAFRVFWLHAPRWLYVPVYLLMAWGAAFFIPDFADRGGTAVVVLLAAGGAAYTAGAVVYGLKRPVLSPRVFGFHEVFHSLTVLGFTAHVVAIGLAAARTGVLG